MSWLKLIVLSMKSRNPDLGLYHSAAKASDQTIAAETTLSAGLTIHAEGIETYVVGESYYQ